MKKYIGNIIVNNLNYSIDTCYKKCLSLSEIDKDIPTLIIGLENARKLIKDFNILQNKYNNGMLWWSFSKIERRADYDITLKDFYGSCINNILYNIKYYNINIYNLNINKIKKIINYILNNNKKLFYIDNNKFIFIYDIEDTKNIYGISLNTCLFFGIKKSKIINLIKSNLNNKEIKNFYSIPNRIKYLLKNDILKEIVILEYFNKK